MKPTIFILITFLLSVSCFSQSKSAWGYGWGGDIYRIDTNYQIQNERRWSDYTDQYQYKNTSFSNLCQANNGLFYGIAENKDRVRPSVIYEFNAKTLEIKYLYELPQYYFRQYGVFTLGHNNKLYASVSSKTGASGFIIEYDPILNSFREVFSFSNKWIVKNQISNLVEVQPNLFYAIGNSQSDSRKTLIISIDVISNQVQVVEEIFSSGYTKENRIILQNKKIFHNKKIFFQLKNIKINQTQNNYGAIVEYDWVDDTTKVLHSFSGIDGENPSGGLTFLNDSTLIGLTKEGGLFNNGVIFEFNTQANIFKKNIDLDTTTIGIEPNGSLLLLDNKNLYGLSQTGGQFNSGVLFEYNFKKNKLKKIYDLHAEKSGKHPLGSLIRENSNQLLGISTDGAINNAGSIFKYDLLDSVISNTSFQSCYLDSVSGRMTQINQGELYGMYSHCDSNGFGVIFRYSPNSKEFKTIHSFDSIDGSRPIGELLNFSDSLLIGVTEFGGKLNQGVLFEYNIRTESYRKLSDLDSLSIGKGIVGSLALTDSNKILGLSSNGGINGFGVIFSFDYNSKEISILHEFDRINGAHPDGGLLNLNNIFYGITKRGGISGKGTLFSFNAKSNQFIKEHDFSSINFPFGKLNFSDSSKLVGTAFRSNHPGFIYEFDLNQGIISNSTVISNVNADFGYGQIYYAYEPIGNLTKLDNGKFAGMAKKGWIVKGGWNFLFNPKDFTFPRSYPRGGNEPYAELANLLVINDCFSSTNRIEETFCNQYISNDSSVIIKESGTYFLSDTLLNSCSLDSIINRKITIIKDNSISESDSSILSNNQFARYQWLDCNQNYSEIIGENSAEFTYSDTGTYAVEIEFNGCIDTSNCIQIKSVGLVDNEIKNSAISIYPNPSKDYFTIKSKKSTISSLRLFSITGRLIYADYTINSNSYRLETPLKNGVYFLEILEDTRTVFKKIIKSD